ncbi:hypothetical protein [Pseudoalteromonas nigrifaciens]|uniref:hypothetical protein n=1 Tax=Pseudoalteromonas nigrifaciens TaxID=28109 RepID=UPI003FB865F4
MSNVIRVPVRIKKESKLGEHLLCHSQLSSNGNELLRLALQGLLYEKLVNNGAGMQLSLNNTNYRDDESSLAQAGESDQGIGATSKVESVADGQVDSEYEQVDLQDYLGRYIDNTD